MLKRPWKGSETDWSSILDSPSYSLSELLFSCVQLSSFGYILTPIQLGHKMLGLILFLTLISPQAQVLGI